MTHRAVHDLLDKLSQFRFTEAKKKAGDETATKGVSLESFEDISHEVLFILGDRLQDATSDFVEATAKRSPKQAAQQKAALEAVLKTLEDTIKARLQGTRQAIR